MPVSHPVDGVWTALVDHVEPLGTTCAQLAGFSPFTQIRASQTGLTVVDAKSLGVSPGVASSGVLYCVAGPSRLTRG